MLTVACYFWRSADNPCPYTLTDVDRLRHAVADNLAYRHDFLVITDDPAQFAGTGIRAAPIPPMRAPTGMFAAPKLATFHPDAARLFGERLLVMDLDVLVTGDLERIVSREENLVLWRNPCRQPWAAPSRRALFNTSLVMLTAGIRGDIWTRAMSGEADGYPGDQDWVSALTGPHCPYWDETDGVYRLAREDTPGSGVESILPENARIVFFPGDEGKAHLPHVRARAPWIEEVMS